MLGHNVNCSMSGGDCDSGRASSAVNPPQCARLWQGLGFLAKRDEEGVG